MHAGKKINETVSVCVGVSVCVCVCGRVCECVAKHTDPLLAFDGAIPAGAALHFDAGAVH